MNNCIGLKAHAQMLALPSYNENGQCIGYVHVHV